MGRDLVIELRKYIGRGYDDYNCFDLVKEFYKDQFGLDLQHYWEGKAPHRTEAESLIKTNKGDFTQVIDPQFGDIVIIRLGGLECHMGVVLEGGKFLHSARHIGSMIDRLERYHKLIAGYYRHTERE